jgi:hypothetical protein
LTLRWPARTRRPSCCASTRHSGPRSSAAAQELRSANAQVEYLLRDALTRRGRKSVDSADKARNTSDRKE